MTHMTLCPENETRVFRKLPTRQLQGMVSNDLEKCPAEQEIRDLLAKNPKERCELKDFRLWIDSKLDYVRRDPKETTIQHKCS